ncbi:hypothetical protein [Hymenobacter sp. BRD67]|uniref:hypothetical protein n=1 Tax=Hymenobacter sp. BRD67 TaxID=2675877 RepID=UPI0015641B40|nr:hypothetical protein [Hymenobacter sp. BRD67]QKG52952.1 hypothetical protein GKZ67_10450 [Hymenobacter sp. BRD67]
MASLFTPFSKAPNHLRLLVSGAALFALTLAAPAAQAQTWMVSTTPYIKLGILDKYNSLGGFTATFFVTSEKSGQEFMLTKQVAKGQNGVDVLFPTEPSDPEYFKNAQGWPLSLHRAATSGSAASMVKKPLAATLCSPKRATTLP